MDVVQIRELSPEALERLQQWLSDPRGTIQVLDDQNALRQAAAEAFHVLLHRDAHISERVDAAKKLAPLLGIPWPPYSDHEEEDGE